MLLLYCFNGKNLLNHSENKTNHFTSFATKLEQGRIVKTGEETLDIRSSERRFYQKITVNG